MRKVKEEQREAAAKLEKQAEEKRQREQANTATSTLGEELGPLDTTLRLKWSRKQFPHLETEKDAMIALLPVKADAIDSLVLSAKMLNNAKLKNGTAVISFKTLTSAVKVMEGSGKGLLKDVELSWAAGQEPEAVRRVKQRNNTTYTVKEKVQEQQQPMPSIPLPTLDEDSILQQMRAREKERERLEEELRRQDEQDDANAA
jgi:DnaJ family protein C protein 17